jgi:hypothetical protein
MRDESEKTLLAWRKLGLTRRRPGVVSQGAVTVGSVLLAASFAALGCSHSDAAGILVVFSVAFFSAAFGLRDVPLEMDPFPEGPEGHRRAVGLLAGPRDKLEHAHSFLGWLHGTGRRVPVLLHDELPKVHMLVTGATKSHKSTRVVGPALEQIASRERCSIVFCNLKGSQRRKDNALFSGLRRLGARRGMSFLFYSVVKERASHLLLLLNDPAFNAMSENQAAQAFCSAMGLEHGEGFGAGYFGAMAELLFKRLIQLCRHSKKEITPRRLLRLVSDRSIRKLIGMTRRDFENASQVIPTLDRFAEDPRLNMTA